MLLCKSVIFIKVVFESQFFSDSCNDTEEEIDVDDEEPVLRELQAGGGLAPTE